MIRKIILALAALFSIFWLIVGHNLKNKVMYVIDSVNSDNMNISYKDLSLSGFPFRWEVEILEPKITLVSQNKIQEFSPEQMVINSGITKGGVDFGRKIQYLEYEGANTASYFFIGKSSLSIDLQSSKILLFQGSKNMSFADDIEFMNSNWSDIICTQENDNKEILNLPSLDLMLEKNHNDLGSSYHFKIWAEVESLTNQLRFQKGSFSLDGEYLIANNIADGEEAEKNFDHKLDILSLQLKIDEASLDLKGGIKLSRTNPPRGKFDANIVQYHSLIDQVVPDNFIFAPSLIKKVISKANMIDISKNDISNASFKIIFSNQGVSIGKFNLLSPKTE